MLISPIKSVGQHHAPIIAGTDSITITIIQQQFPGVSFCWDSSNSGISSGGPPHAPGSSFVMLNFNSTSSSSLFKRFSVCDYSSGPQPGIFNFFSKTIII